MSKIVLWVSDLNHQAEFYAALLAAPISSDGPEFAEVSDGQNSVLIHLLSEQYRALIPAGEVADVREEAAIKPVFTVSDIEGARSRVEKYGIRFGSEKNIYGDIVYLDCIDPEGNVIQLSQQI
jgi:predicted enzyme related to lactoylglutathione lyase